MTIMTLTDIESRLDFIENQIAACTCPVRLVELQREVQGLIERIEGMDGKAEGK